LLPGRPAAWRAQHHEPNSGHGRKVPRLIATLFVALLLHVIRRVCEPIQAFANPIILVDRMRSARLDEEIVEPTAWIARNKYPTRINSRLGVHRQLFAATRTGTWIVDG
jgi:hypothetical protein